MRRKTGGEIKKDGKTQAWVLRRTNHKGFSLVELIVVVAIMAVLVGVLAPQYLRYVEKARLQKDNTAIAEIVEAIKLAMISDEAIYNEVAQYGSHPYTLISGSRDDPSDLSEKWKLKIVSSSHYPRLIAELQRTVGEVYTLESNTYTKNRVQVQFYPQVADDGTIQVTVLCRQEEPYYGSAAYTKGSVTIY